MMKPLLLALSVYLAVISAGVRAGFEVNVNVTDYLAHRQRRTLTYPNGGNIKILIGPAFNVGLGDPLVWRSVVMLYNFHLGEYQMPANPLYPWDKWEDTFARSLQRMRDEYSQTGRYSGDNSRLFLYVALEQFIALEGHDGRSCLLRAICENAQVDQHVGFFTELLNVVLTPGHEDIDDVYREARDLGASGADCLRSYEKCPLGATIMDRYWHHL